MSKSKSSKIFEQVFGTEKNITVSFVNAALKLQEENSVEEVEYIKNDVSKEDSNIYIQCIDRNKTIFLCRNSSSG